MAAGRAARLGSVVAMVVGVAGLLSLAWRPVSEAPIPAIPERARTTAAVTVVGADAPETPIPATAVRPESPPRDRPPDRSPTATPDAPYRFIGRTGEGPDAAFVLFGRGRTLTFSGPGRLDDEHAVEAVDADYVVVRHLPSGAGTLLMLTPPSNAAAIAQDPEQFPRD